AGNHRHPAPHAYRPLPRRRRGRAHHRSRPRSTSGDVLDRVPAGVRPLPVGGRSRPGGAARRRPDRGGCAVKDVFLKKKLITRPGELKRHYDVVIIGGGSHGLSTAYYLATHHGIDNVAILEKSYIGSGAAGRNTTIIRANYRTPEGAAFYKESVELYKLLSQDLNFNLMFSQHGHFTLAHSDRSLVVQQERAEVNKLLG